MKNLRRQKRCLAVVAFVALFALAGCGSSEDKNSAASAPVEPGGDFSPPPVEQLADTGIVTVGDETLPASGESVQEMPIGERIVIKNASLEIVVEDAGETGAAISNLAESMGGWVVSSNVSSYEDTIAGQYTQGTVTIRVPAEQFDAALDQIRAFGQRVRSENITGEDVTAEYVDLSSQLENLRASEEQLRQIMDSADTVPDVLAVRTELERVRGDINVIEGRLRFFRESADFSSITVRLIRVVGEETDSDGWSPRDTLDEASGVLVDIARVSADAIIWVVVVLLPIGLVLIVAGYAALLLGLRALRFVLRRLPKP